MSQIKRLLRQLKQLEQDQRLNRSQFKGNNPIGLYIFKKRLILSRRFFDLEQLNKATNFFKKGK